MMGRFSSNTVLESARTPILSNQNLLSSYSTQQIDNSSSSAYKPYHLNSPPSQLNQQRHHEQRQQTLQQTNHQHYQNVPMLTTGPPQQQQKKASETNFQLQNHSNHTKTAELPSPNPIQRIPKPSTFSEGTFDATSRQQARVEAYPKNIPMMALQQQKVF